MYGSGTKPITKPLYIKKFYIKNKIIKTTISYLQELCVAASAVEGRLLRDR